LATGITRYIQPDGRAIHKAMNQTTKNTGKVQFPCIATKSPALKRGVSGGILIKKPEHISWHFMALQGLI